MGKRTAAGFLFLIGFLRVMVSGQDDAQYCSDAHGEVPSINMCVAGNKTVTDSYVYLDSTGAPTYETSMCSCELEFDFTTALDIKYRTENVSNCGIKFQLNKNVWTCEHYGSDNVRVVQVQALSNLTFFRSEGNAKHVRACMGLKPGVGSLTVRCFPWEYYIPPSSTVSMTHTAVACTTTKRTITTTIPTTTTPTASTKTPTTTTTTSSTTTTTPTPTTTTPTTATTTTTTLTTTTTTTRTTTTTAAVPATSTTITIPSSAPPEPTQPQPSSTTNTKAPTGLPTVSSPAASMPSASRSSSTSGKSITEKGTPTPTGSTATPIVAEVEEPTNTAAIAGGVVGGIFGLILLIVLVVCLICLVGRRREKQKKQILFGPRTVRYNSNASSGDVQITENALYDSENPSTAVNQLFIGGIPRTPGARDSELPRFEVPDGDPRYTEVGAVNATNAKVRDEPNLSTFRKGSSGSETSELKLNNEYSEIDAGISNPGYDSNYKAPYTMPYDNKLGVGTGEKAESVISSPYDYIDHDKLERDDEEASKQSYGDYKRLISNPNDHSLRREDSESGIGRGFHSESDRESRLHSSSGPGSRLSSEAGHGTRTGNESAPGRRLGSESGPGSRLSSESGPGSRLGSSSGYANDLSPDYKTGYGDDAHFGYDQ